jgi:hypothetical protein
LELRELEIFWGRTKVEDYRKILTGVVRTCMGRCFSVWERFGEDVE